MTGESRWREVGVSGDGVSTEKDRACAIRVSLLDGNVGEALEWPGTSGGKSAIEKLGGSELLDEACSEAPSFSVPYSRGE